MVKSNTMAKANGAVDERRRDAQRLLLIEGVQSATALGLLGMVAYRGVVAPPAAGTSEAMATFVFIELVVALVAAVALLALGLRARMGRELVVLEIARLEAEHEELEARRHPYRERAGAHGVSSAPGLIRENR